MSKAKVEFGDNTAVGNYSQLLGSPIVSGAFFQLAVTRSSAGQLKTYVDGTLVTTDDVVPAVGTYSGAAIALGNNGNGILDGFTGVIDEVSMYNRVLTQDEVSSLFLMQ